MKSKILINFIIILFLFISNCIAQERGYYQKKDSWIKTLIASREAYMKQYDKDHPSSNFVFGPWYYVGPFIGESKDSFDEKFAPENDNKLGIKYNIGEYKWEKQPEWIDGTIIPLPSLLNSAVYIQRNIKCRGDTTIKAYFGSGDGLKVWFNNVLVISHNITRNCKANQDTAELKFLKGSNKLFIKINNNWGGSDFYFSIYKTEKINNQIWRRIERDFRKMNDLMEISWVQHDKIWEKDWMPGNYFEIAEKYANAVKSISPKTAAEIRNQSPLAKDIRSIELINSEYDKAKESEYIILTPKPSPKPKINGPQIYGVRPGSPFLYRIPATGLRPMEFSVEGLPPGLRLDEKTGIITGSIKDKGEYALTFKAKNMLSAAERKFKIVCGDKIALTPPMGWNSWYGFSNTVSEKKMRAAVEAMIKSRLVDHGWSYIDIDDFWQVKPSSKDSTLQGEPRDKNGYIIPNKRFPDMKALGDYIHDKGLKFGIYSSPGAYTCGGCIGSYQHEDKDAQRYGEWGVDLLKYDWCSYRKIAKDTSIESYQKPYIVMGDALKKVNRDIVYSLCQYGMGNVWEWGAKIGANLWRTTGDILDIWERMSPIAFGQNGHEKYAGPGHWNDPDMLMVGMLGTKGWNSDLYPTRLTPDEQYTQVSMWCLLAAPLLISCDMTHLDNFTLSLLTNDEVIAVDQDTLGIGASRISLNDDTEIWAKKLSDGSMAVGLFNRGAKKMMVEVNFHLLGLSKRCIVRDLWRQKKLGLFTNHFTTTVHPHGVVLVKIKEG